METSPGYGRKEARENWPGRGGGCLLIYKLDLNFDFKFFLVPAVTFEHGLYMCARQDIYEIYPEAKESRRHDKRLMYAQFIPGRGTIQI